jgi:hypothetical protein
MKNVICFLMVVAPLFGAEPMTVGQAEMAYNREFNEAMAVFDARVKAAQDKFVIFLKEEMKRLTTAGDLDGAIAIREKIKSFDPPPPKESAATSEKNPQPQSWDDIKAPVLVVQANKPLEVGLLGPGKWEIIPNMNDKWTTAKKHPFVSCTGEKNPTKDDPTSFKYPDWQGIPMMYLINKFSPASSEETTNRYDSIIVGPGKLVLQANDNSFTDNLGSIRVKIVKVK